jgi:predicted aconitase
MGSIVGYVPYFGLLTDEGRKATWIVKVETEKKPEAQLLGSAIGMKVMEAVPYVYGLDKWIGNELNDDACTYLKDFGAATASNGAVGLYHIDNLTPEAKSQGETLIKDDAKVYVIDDEELERVYKSYPLMWKKKDAKPNLCFIGCPHLTYKQLVDWTEKLEAGLKAAGKRKVAVRTVMTTPPDVKERFKKTEYYSRLTAMGVKVASICPLMYTNNPMTKGRAIITNSNKLRTYSVARYLKDDDICDVLCGKEIK